MASEGGGEHGGGMAEYISHHLQHLATAKQDGLFDVNVLHLDTVFFAVLCGLLALIPFYFAARRATAGVPGRFQAFVEMLVEFVEEQAKGMVHGKLTFIAPLALTVFVWVAMMNAIDLFPVDLLSAHRSQLFHIDYLRPLPTADLNGTFGMAIAVLLLVVYYNIKIKGVGGWLHQWVTAPFGNGEDHRESADLDRRAGARRRQRPVHRHRIHRQHVLARHASVRKHVRGRADFLSDRRSRRQPHDFRRRHAPVQPARCGRSSTS